MSATVWFGRQRRPCPATERPPKRAQYLEIGRSSAAPLTGSLSRRLTDDGVDNKANRGDFAGWPVWGWLSPGRIPQSGVPSGPIRVRGPSRSPTSRRTSFGPRPLANRPHRRSNLGRFARGRSRGAIARLDVSMGYLGSSQIISEHFWIDEGDCGEGRAIVSLGRAPTAPRLAALMHQAVQFPGIAGRSASLLRSSRRKESNEVGHE